jgi:hypothetical protein
MPPTPRAHGGNRSAQGSEIREVYVRLVPGARRASPPRSREPCHRLDDDQGEDRNIGEPHDEFVAERCEDETQAPARQVSVTPLCARLELGAVWAGALANDLQRRSKMGKWDLIEGTRWFTGRSFGAARPGIYGA